MKPKKQLTTKQKKNRYRAVQWSCLIGEILSILAPFVTIGVVNFDEYFVQTGAEAWKISTAGILALAVMGVTIWSLSHKVTKDNKTFALASFGIGWLVVATILTLLTSIIADVAMIMYCAAIGIFVAIGLDITSVKYKTKADKYKNYIEENEMRRSNLETDAQYEAEKQAKIEEHKKKGLR